MRRREFISLLGGAATAWPKAVRAQQPGKVPIIGFLGSGNATTAEAWVVAFAQRLRELGWVEDRTIRIDLRWAEGRSDRSAEIATEFVRLKVDVIVTYGSEHVQIAKEATSTIPIVFALAGDPVGSGLVASLAHPGGNITGTSSQNADLTGKRFELLREIVPICGGWRSCSTATVLPIGPKSISFGPQPTPSGWKYCQRRFEVAKILHPPLP